MKRALFIMILSCLIVSAVTAQRPVKHNPKQYKVTEADNAGSISRDGRYLSYVDDQTDALFVRDLKTGESRRLTEERSAQSVDNITVISPDGKFVAYSWGTINRGVELRISGLDGSKPRVVYRDKELNRVLPDAWSPDGKHILATFRKKDGTDHIVLVSVSDGSVRVLRTHKTLDLGHGHKESFSPDGRYIAFDFRPEAESLNRDISAIPVDGSGEVPLVQHSANDRLLDWTPDGTGILFASDRSGTWDLWVIVVVDGTPVGSPKLLKRDIFCPGLRKAARLLDGSPPPNPRLEPQHRIFSVLMKQGFDPRSVIDVGANMGEWTRRAIEYLPAAEYTLIEPQAHLKRHVQDLIDKGCKITWRTAGAADVPGILDFTINPRPDSSSFLPNQQEAAVAGFRRVSVEVITLNQLVQTAETRMPEMVKIDAEGFDLKVLAGASELIGKTDIFFVEASVVCPQFDNSVHAVITMMSDAGYRLIDITDLNTSPTHGVLWLCELVFLRKSSLLLQTATSY